EAGFAWAATVMNPVEPQHAGELERFVEVDRLAVLAHCPRQDRAQVVQLQGDALIAAFLLHSARGSSTFRQLMEVPSVRAPNRVLLARRGELRKRKLTHDVQHLEPELAARSSLD